MLGENEEQEVSDIEITEIDQIRTSNGLDSGILGALL
jgi:hypothetical protein